MQGLRTLVYAEKPITEQECEAFLEKYNKAATLMDGREEAVWNSLDLAQLMFST